MINKKIPQKIGVGYIRESSEEQDKGFSPDNQKRSIEKYAKDNNIKLIETYKDLESGGSAEKRTDFQRMMDDAMQKKFEVVLIFHTSRFARNVQESRQYKELLRNRLSIDVVSVTQNFGNHDDPSAFLNEGINELFDDHYLRQLSFWTKAGFAEKRRQGKPLGNPPYGYYKKQAGYDKEKDRPIYESKWLIDKDKAKIVKRMFEMYASGKYSINKIAEVLTKEGYRTNAGNPFTYSTLKCILTNKSYLGLVYSPRRPLPDIPSTTHKAIIKKELFDGCQDVLRQRKGRFGRPAAKHRFYLLQGLVYCVRCKKHLTKKNENSPIKRMHPVMYCQYQRMNNNKDKERMIYCCKFKKENKSCSQPDIKCEIIDNQVLAFMHGFTLPKDIIQSTLDNLKKMFELYNAKDDNAQINKELEKLAQKKKRLKFLFEETGDMDENEYLFKRQQINNEIERLERQGAVKSMDKKKEKEYIKRTEEFLKDFPKFWKRLKKEDQREWITMTIKRIWVKDDKVTAIEPKNEFKALFKAHQKTIKKIDKKPPRIKSNKKTKTMALAPSKAKKTAKVIKVIGRSPVVAQKIMTLGFPAQGWSASGGDSLWSPKWFYSFKEDIKD